jgi:hypothetical protein
MTINKPGPKVPGATQNPADGVFHPVGGLPPQKVPSAKPADNQPKTKPSSK